MIKKEIDNTISKIDTSNYKEGTLEDLKMIKNHSLRSIDFESTSANVHDPEMHPLSVSFTIKDGESRIFFTDKKGKFSKDVINTINDSKAKTIVAARPFEENIIKYKIGQEPKGTFVDVLSMAHILDENKGFRYNLEMVANEYAGMKNIKDMAEGMRGDLINASKKTIINYNGVDSDATLRSYNTMRDMYKSDKKLERYFSFFMQPIQNMFSEISQNGCKIDTKKLKENQSTIIDLMNNLSEDSFSIIPKQIKDKHEKKGLSLTRDIIVRDYLFDDRYGLRLKPVSGYITAKKFLPQITEDHLKYFSRLKFVQLYLKWAKLKKLEGYFPKFWDAIQSDSRIYPNTLFIRTVTGRTVMLDPPVQIFPNRGEYAKYLKECFVSDDGCLWGERDLSQSELRGIGWLAQDPNILGALRKGIDLHTWTVHTVFGTPIDKITKEQRQKAKAINFGFVYAMSAKTFQAYSKDEYNVNFTMDECEKIRKIFFAKPKGYYMLPVYHEAKKFEARKKGYVESVLGRRRRLPGIYSDNYIKRGIAERQAINMPVQSFSTDLGLIGLLMAHKEIKSNPKFRNNMKLYYHIHDSEKFQAKEDFMDNAQKLMKDCMSNRACDYIKKNFGVKIGYPIESEGKYGKNWDDQKKYED